jgi:serine/threonine-protein kinase
MWQAADGSERPTPLPSSGADPFEIEFTHDGHMVVRTGNGLTAADTDLLSFRVGSDSATPFTAAPQAREAAPRLSPDGRWVAYVSNQTGRFEIYVRPWPDPGTGAVWQVSDGGGQEPVWARSGRELFYKSGGNFVSAQISTNPGFAVAKRSRLFPVAGYLNLPMHQRYDVMPGDSTFLLIGEPSVGTPEDIHTVVVENYFEELKRSGQ